MKLFVTYHTLSSEIALLGWLITRGIFIITTSAFLLCESEIVLRGWLIERETFIITISTFLIRARAKCFAWLAYKIKNICNSYISAFFLGVKANLFCIDGL